MARLPETEPWHDDLAIWCDDELTEVAAALGDRR